MTAPRTRLGIAAALVLVLTLYAATVAGAAPLRGAANKPALKRGRVLFVAACGSCHTLAAAKTRGTRGPNLAQEPGSFAGIVARVQRGGEGMPSFAKTLTKVQIANIARYVVAVTPRHGGGGDD